MGACKRGYMVYFGNIFVRGRCTRGEGGKGKECRDGIDRKDEKGCDDGRVGNFCGKYWIDCCIKCIKNKRE